MMVSSGSGSYPKIDEEIMSAVARLDGVMGDVAGASAQVREVQANARARAVHILRKLEAHLRTALDGDSVRGLPNLVPDGRRPFHAARLRSRHADEGLPTDGRPVLVLTAAGKLAMACRYEDTSLTPFVDVYSWDASDEDLRAEDLGAVVLKLQHVLQVHLSRTRAGERRYQECAQLSERLGAALGITVPEPRRV